MTPSDPLSASRSDTFDTRKAGRDKTGPPPDGLVAYVSPDEPRTDSNKAVPPVALLEEMQALMNEGMKLAGQMIQDHGEFYPYGFVMRPTGHFEPVAPLDGDAQPPVGEAVAFLVKRLRVGAQEGRYKAVAMFVNVRVTPQGQSETDAIQIGLEHCNGSPMNVYIPYIKRMSGEVHLGEMFAEERVGEFF